MEETKHRGRPRKRFGEHVFIGASIPIQIKELAEQRAKERKVPLSDIVLRGLRRELGLSLKAPEL